MKRNVQTTTSSTAGDVVGMQKEIVDNAIAGNQSGNGSTNRTAFENSTMGTYIDYRNLFQAHTKRFPIETIVLIVMFSICTIVYISK